MALRIARRALAVGSVLVALVGTAAASDGAESGAALVVERGAGAESCPETEQLAARVREIRGKSDLGHSARRVRFARDADRYTVVIETGNGETRTLESRDATCAELGKAAAVTLALLVDSEPAPPAPPPEAPPAEVVAPPPAPPARDRTSVALTLGASAISFAGVVGALALGGAVDAGLVVHRFRFSVGGAWVPPRELPLGPGHVVEEWAGGFTRLCLAPVATEGFRVDACSGAWMGILSARGEGYTSDDRERRSYVAVPAELAASLWTRRVAVELAAGALFPLHRSDYTVDGLGVAYASPAVVALVSLRVSAVVPLGPR